IRLCAVHLFVFFFFSSRRRHTRFSRDWSSDVCSSDLNFRRTRSAWRKNGKESRVCLGKIIQAKIKLPEQKRLLIEAGEKSFVVRSEERRVGKECRSRWSQYR